MDKTEKDNLHTVYDLVMDNVVTTWPQIEIQGALRGIEIDDKMFIDLMRYILLDKFYRFYYRSINESDDCLRFLENSKVIDHILMKEGCNVTRERIGNSMFPDEFKFSCVEFLGQAEMLHPSVFLKYLLKGDTSSIMESMKTGYLALLRMVIKRTRIRARKAEEYRKFVPTLDERYREYCNIEMYLN